MTNMPEKPESLSQDEYQRLFSEHRTEALKAALDIRKFEIELYWKRAAYFWTLIAASFAGYGAVQASQTLTRRSPNCPLSWRVSVLCSQWAGSARTRAASNGRRTGRITLTCWRTKFMGLALQDGDETSTCTWLGHD